MRYLVTYRELDVQTAFYTDWFSVENNFNETVDMIVFDLKLKKYIDKDLVWKPIGIDHL